MTNAKASAKQLLLRALWMADNLQWAASGFMTGLAIMRFRTHEGNWENFWFSGMFLGLPQMARYAAALGRRSGSGKEQK